ncbi:MAG: response regulator [Gammaproteobacteria bacterium]|nr:response regulator [Gammaproteobacteria bacterium]
MSQERVTVYQSNLVAFDEVKKLLSLACHEDWDGVLLLVTNNGDGAGFSFNHGKIIDVGYKTKRGNAALLDIKNIEYARFFFEQDVSGLPYISNIVEHDLSDTAEVLKLLDIEKIEKAPAVVEKPLSIKKVMVVDDSRMVRAIAKKILVKASYEVVEVADGEYALEEIEKQCPDLVLLDIVMPGIDGNEVLRRIRQTEFGQHLPVIVMTSTDSVVEADSSETGRLAKPFKPNDIVARLDEYFLQSESTATCSCNNTFEDEMS